MMTENDAAEGPEALLRLWPDYQPTPLVSLPRLAEALGIAEILVKNEALRPLGSFKSLGGMYAGLRALARHAQIPTIAGLVRTAPHADFPPLVCASDGNHGLAVAAAARLAGAGARVFLPSIVPENRAARIAGEGAVIVRINGSYEDAVEAARAEAASGKGILIADTTDQPGDPAVADVMAGYGIIAREIRGQLAVLDAPTHLFLQAGVGGFAAAMADGLAAILAAPAGIIIAEPQSAACVGAALAAGRVVRLPGALETSAEMLSCGEASAPALARLVAHDAGAIAVPESRLTEAVAMLGKFGGLATTPSGAAGLAGLLEALSSPGMAARFQLGSGSRVLLTMTEGLVPFG